MRPKLLAPALLGAALLVLGAGEAAACPSCASAMGSQAWFRYTTVLLSLIPLAAIGGVIWWIRRQVSAGDAGPGA